MLVRQLSSVLYRPAVRWQSSSGGAAWRDIVISGGGLVGLALAAALVSDPVLRHCRITLLDAGRRPRPAPAASAEYSNRVCALSPASRALLQRCGAWPRLLRYNTVQHMQVWETRSDAMIRFEKQPPDDLAYVVENDVLCAALLAALEAQSAVDLQLVFGVGARQIELPPERDPQTPVRLVLSDGRQVNCALLIGADGTKSAVRTAMAVRTLSSSYDQMGVVGTLELDTDAGRLDCSRVAWQRFLDSGPLALLPLSVSRSSLVWSTGQQEARRLLNMSEEHFVDALNARLWEEHRAEPAVQWAGDQLRGLLSSLGLARQAGPRQLPPSVRALVPGSRAAFPLALQHAAHYHCRRAVLVGDAARRIHPLAGQGANLGFGDVARLSELLSAAAQLGADLASRSHLQQYQAERQRASVLLIGLTDALSRLYGTETLPVVLARSLGLELCHSIQPVKQLLMDSARN